VTDLARSALLLIDLQNDFLHPDGAYGRAGQRSAAIATLPERIRPLKQAFAARGAWTIATQFTLVPGRGGAPIISPHLRKLRPFLGAGDFAPGSFGQAVVEALQPVDLLVEKVTYSAFYMTRLEWLLRKCAIEHLYVAGIVTNGGIASTVRDAHVRDLRVTVIEDACAAFDDATHQAAIAGLRPVAEITTVADAIAALGQDNDRSDRGS
jgi:ureidoacrylate peracid hydrolase